MDELTIRNIPNPQPHCEECNCNGRIWTGFEVVECEDCRRCDGCAWVLWDSPEPFFGNVDEVYCGECIENKSGTGYFGPDDEEQIAEYRAIVARREQMERDLKWMRGLGRLGRLMRGGE